jgi:Cu-Zn family superoxide dismutase
MVVGCAAGGSGEVVAPERDVSVSATFGTAPDGVAITYLPDLVPVGALGTVGMQAQDETSVRLAVDGLLPSRTYGAHVHTKPCGADGNAAGPHFQHEPDPQQPSTDPRYANPVNEIWLDLTTDAAGSGSAQATVPWQFAENRPGSVVIHADPTSTEPGKAGTAGARAACISVGF